MTLSLEFFKRITGFEPVSLVWKTKIITTIRYPHIAQEETRTPTVSRQILSLVRLPFRHSGMEVSLGFAPRVEGLQPSAFLLGYDTKG